ncbi:PP2C family serine/threonine-protein phosphatase [Frankia sp. AgKG'84/4]|uniref:PP2C family serine/threonine-protein phosphatase n=1 Tax=Frankia sp. AgKG'84/4 TaxID=573490 RepID=UPI00200E5006|nr:PP2C family serine/threonine-protein phosphatase [Frankia sp. AgKG'84/4]MCL9796611.1 protein phosphatase 2C domain-containing protein [Frankia sp. AgKG'84/4]
MSRLRETLGREPRPDRQPSSGPPPGPDLPPESDPTRPSPDPTHRQQLPPRGREEPDRANVPVGDADVSVPTDPQPPAAPAAADPPRPGLPGHWDLRSPATSAPTIGRVLAPPPPRLQPATDHRRPMLTLDSVFLGTFHVAAGSMAGTAHLHAGTPCQDAYDFGLRPDGPLVVAVADGLGSRACSQVGARAFCEAAVRLGMAPDGPGAAELLTHAAELAAREADRLGLARREVSFVGAVATFGPDEYVIARVGDVSAFALVDGEFQELLANDADGQVNVVTAALPESPAAPPEVSRTAVLTPVVLCTDGLATDLRTSPGVRSWLAESWERPADVHGMAQALRYRRRGSHDDRTALLITPMDRPAEAWAAPGPPASS